MISRLKSLGRVAAVAGVAAVALGSGVAAQASTVTPALGGTTGCPSSGYIDNYFTCTSLSNGVLQHYKYTNDVATTAYYKTGGSAVSVKVGYAQGSSTHYSVSSTISSGGSKSATWTGVAYCTTTVGLLSASSNTYQTPPAVC
jgi:hypothetical protein